MQLTARKAMRYDCKPVKVGDRFEASPKDARLLIAAKLASEAPPVPKKAKQVPAVERAIIKEDPPPVIVEASVTFDEVAPKPKRTYVRRDMIADAE